MGAPEILASFLSSDSKSTVSVGQETLEYSNNGS